MRNKVLALWTASVVILGCGGTHIGGTGPDGGSSGGTTGGTITITQFAFSPASLTVAPGATVTVENKDTAQHSVTSQTAAGTYAPGAVAGITFDTGVFVGTRTFTVPASAHSGTVIPYYCTVHGAMMANAGQIVIQ